jgi:hypothetical protein
MVPAGFPAQFPRPPKRLAHRLEQSRKDEIVAGYQAGIYIAELAKQLRVLTVQKHVRQAGLPRRLLRLDSAGVREVVDLYVAGTSAESIGKRVKSPRHRFGER